MPIEVRSRLAPAGWCLLELLPTSRHADGVAQLPVGALYVHFYVGGGLPDPEPEGAVANPLQFAVRRPDSSAPSRRTSRRGVPLLRPLTKTNASSASPESDACATSVVAQLRSHSGIPKCRLSIEVHV